MTFQELLEKGTSMLTMVGIEEAELEARLLLEHVSGLTRSELFLQVAEPCHEKLSGEYLALIRTRCSRIPLQHITGSKEFWSLDFVVSPAVLIPRPETEFVLDYILTTLQKDNSKVTRALDLCTGSGVIGVVLAQELGCQVAAVDLSTAALSVARENCAKHDCLEQVSLLASDLFAGLRPGRIFDLIVSNPPYIAEGDLASLAPEVREHEPRLALTGGERGLDCIAQIVQESKKYLQKDCWLFMEIGMDQGDQVCALLAAAGCYTDIAVTPDWSGRDRVVQARLIK